MTHFFQTICCLPHSILMKGCLLSLILWLGTVFADGLHTWPGFTVSGWSVHGSLLSLLWIDSAPSLSVNCFLGHTSSPLPCLYCLTIKDSTPSISEGCLLDLVFKDAGCLCQQVVYSIWHKDTAVSLSAGCLLGLMSRTLPRLCCQAVYMASCQGFCSVSAGRISTQHHVNGSASSLLAGCLLSIVSRTLLCPCWQAVYSA